MFPFWKLHHSDTNLAFCFILVVVTMQSSLNIQKINEVPFNLVKVTSVKLTILASKFSVDTRKQSVNRSHFTLQWLPPDCDVDLQNVKCLIYFYLCKGSHLLTPFVCVCVCVFSQDSQVRQSTTYSLHQPQGNKEHGTERSGYLYKKSDG